jgi:hypothetical protein
VFCNDWFRYSLLGISVTWFVATEIGTARGERVGFAFTGNLVQVGSPGTYTMFGKTVPKTSPVTGTFSYDTTSTGVAGGDGNLAFRQLIQGGYTLNVNNGDVRISASDYTINLTDDFQPGTGGDPIDYLDVDFSSMTAVPQSLQVNGVVYSSLALLKSVLAWDSDAFEQLPGEPLHAQLPGSELNAYNGFIGGSSPRAMMVSSITPIVPMAGDYNVNGVQDVGDFVEWRKAFGGSMPVASYADGNHDNFVDGADYVVWRMMSAASGSLGGPNVPEAGATCSVVLLLSAFAQARLKRRGPCRAKP